MKVNNCPSGEIFDPIQLKCIDKVPQGKKIIIK
jgi:hypothetical protein